MIVETDIAIRPMKEADWTSVSQIYKEGIATGYATFEKDIPSYESWDLAHMKACRLVAEKEGSIGQNNRGMGVGKLLMESLIQESEKEGLWTLQSGIFPENNGSIKLHEQVGFRFIGKRERVGKLDNTWRDNLLFERRSQVVGVN